MIVGKRIKEARMAIKISQKELAESLGIDPSQFSKIEGGKIMPTLMQMIEISKKLKKPIDWFVYNTNELNLALKPVSTDENYKEFYELAKLNIQLLQKVESLNNQIKILEDQSSNQKNKRYKAEDAYSLVAEPQSELSKKKV